MIAQYVHQIAHELTHAHFFQRFVGVAAHHHGHVPFEVPLGDIVLTGGGQPQQARGGTAGVGLHHPQHQRDQVITEFLTEVPDHAEVDDGNAPVRLHEQVARVRVRVEETVFEHHLANGVRGLPRQQVTIHAGVLQGRVVVDLDADHPFHGQHTGGGGLPVDLRDVDARVTGEVLRHPLGVSGLLEVVQFPAQ